MLRIILLTMLMSLAYAGEERLVIGDFSSGSLSGWEHKSFEGNTVYALVEFDGHRVLKAQSDRSASGMFKEIEVDLYETPYMNWSWRVENTLGELNEKSREGDDYPARVYVVVSGKLFFWRTRALNYVWSSSQQAGSEWVSAYTDNARLIAVQGGDQALGQWMVERRNIREDFNKQFGKDIRYIDAVAVMTDTDNSGGKATAYYGDIYFSKQ